MESTNRKSIINKVSNVVFFAALLLLLLSTDAKSWVLRQLVSVGFYNARIEPATEAASAKPFSFTDDRGNNVSTADLQGKVIFINFWASWCPPCRAEMPALNNLYQQMKNEDKLVFLFLNEDEDLSKAKKYLDKEGFTLPLFTTQGGIPPEIYSGTLPTTVIIDKEGRVVMKEEGMADYDNTAFVGQLRELLNR